MISLPADLAQRILDAARIAAALHLEDGAASFLPIDLPGHDGAFEPTFAGETPAPQ